MGNASEAVKKLAKSPKTQDALVDNQKLANAKFRELQFFHSFSVTAGDRLDGVRPSSGAATLALKLAPMKSDAWKHSVLAAPEDGRTPAPLPPRRH
jgi:hypothetical protein